MVQDMHSISNGIYVNKKQMRSLEKSISSFYKSEPKIMITCYTAPEI